MKWRSWAPSRKKNIFATHMYQACNLSDIQIWEIKTCVAASHFELEKSTLTLTISLPLPITSHTEPSCHSSRQCVHRAIIVENTALFCRYHRYTGIKLPSMYNAEFETFLKTKKLTASGAKPLTIHFTFHKPFNVTADDYRWEYLCYRPKMVMSMTFPGSDLQTACMGFTVHISASPKKRCQGQMGRPVKIHFILLWCTTVLA